MCRENCFFSNVGESYSGFKRIAHEVIMRNKWTEGYCPYKLSHSPLGQGGYFFGVYPMSLLNSPEARECLMDILTHESVDTDVVNRVIASVSIKTRILSASDINLVNQILRSDYGHQKINEVYEAFIEEQLKNFNKLLAPLSLKIKNLLESNNYLKGVLFDFCASSGVEVVKKLRQFLEGKQIFLDEEKLQLDIESMSFEALVEKIYVFVSSVLCDDIEPRLSNIRKIIGDIQPREIKKTIMPVNDYGVRLRNEEMVIKKIQNIVPKDFTLGSAIGKGDCFFDSIARALNNLKEDNVHTAKALRRLCDQYAKDQKNTWVKEAVEKDRQDGQDWNEYLARIQFTAEEMEHLNRDRILTGTAIWGRSDIEGRMICESLNIRLHLVEVLDENQIIDGVEVLQQIVDNNSSKSIDDFRQEAYADKPLVHLVVYHNHFVPLINENLKKNLSLVINSNSTNCNEYDDSQLYDTQDVASESLVQTDAEKQLYAEQVAVSTTFATDFIPIISSYIDFLRSEFGSLSLSEATCFFSYARVEGTPFSELETWTEDFINNLYTHFEWAGLKPLMDIHHSRYGSNMQDFMKKGVRESSIVFLFGTRSLYYKLMHQYYPFTIKTEVDHILQSCDVDKEKPRLIPILVGGSLEDSFPAEKPFQLRSRVACEEWNKPGLTEQSYVDFFGEILRHVVEQVASRSGNTVKPDFLNRAKDCWDELIKPLKIKLHSRLLVQDPAWNLDTVSGADIVERKDELDRIQQALGEENGFKAVVLTGLPGSGKTTLLQLFFSRVLKKGFYQTVHCLHAGGAFLANLHILALQLKLANFKPKASDRQGRISEFLNAIFKYLNQSESWLLIIDNIEKSEDLKALGDIVTNCDKKQHVLLSSRRALNDFNFRPENLPVSKFLKNDAIEFARKNNSNLSDGDVTDLLEEVCSLPLVFRSVVLYLKRCVRTYSDFKSSMSSCGALAWTLFPEESQINPYKALTIIVEDFLEKESGWVRDFFYISALLNPDDQPREIYNALSGDFLSDNALLKLKEYSFLSLMSTSVSVHRELQAIIIARMARRDPDLIIQYAKKLFKVFIELNVDRLITPVLIRNWRLHVNFLNLEKVLTNVSLDFETGLMQARCYQISFRVQTRKRNYPEARVFLDYSKKFIDKYYNGHENELQFSDLVIDYRANRIWAAFADTKEPCSDEIYEDARKLIHFFKEKYGTDRYSDESLIKYSTVVTNYVFLSAFSKGIINNDCYEFLRECENLLKNREPSFPEKNGLAERLIQVYRATHEAKYFEKKYEDSLEILTKAIFLAENTTYFPGGIVNMNNMLLAQARDFIFLQRYTEAQLPCQKIINQLKGKTPSHPSVAWEYLKALAILKKLQPPGADVTSLDQKIETVCQQHSFDYTDVQSNFVDRLFRRNEASAPRPALMP